MFVSYIGMIFANMYKREKRFMFAEEILGQIILKIKTVPILTNLSQSVIVLFGII